MGDTYKEGWMSQLPFTLLGRRVAFQPDLQMSASDLTFGTTPLIPGVIVEGPKGKDDPHRLLQNLQLKDAQPAIPMSRHRKPDTVYMPETENASHVYVKVEKPENLGVKYVGPFPIVSRP